MRDILNKILCKDLGDDTLYHVVRCLTFHGLSLKLVSAVEFDSPFVTDIRIRGYANVLSLTYYA